MKTKRKMKWITFVMIGFASFIWISEPALAALEDTLVVKTQRPDPSVAGWIAFFGSIVSKKWVGENGFEKLQKHAMASLQSSADDAR